MMTSTQMYGQVFGEHHFGDLFFAFGLNLASERALFESLYDELERHSVFFGCADHPDVQDDILEQVWEATLQNLADSARRGARGDVRWYVIGQFLRSLRSARGLPGRDLDPELERAIEPAAARLAAALSWGYVPLREMFGYNRALARHYVVNPESFEQLVDWTCALLARSEAADDESEAADDETLANDDGRAGSQASATWSGYRRCRQEIDRCRQTRCEGPSQVPDTQPVVEAPAPAVVLWAQDQDIALPAWRMLVDQRPISEAELHNPQSLARLTAEYAPTEEDPMGNARFFTSAWMTILVDDVKRAGVLNFDASSVGTHKRLPRLTEAVLLCHVLGLEASDRRAILSRAADGLLVHVLLPAARAVGASSNRHEPLAGYLVTVIASILRPWTFTAPPLSTRQRVVLIHALAELATGTSRKLLHAEKKHADSHPDPAMIRHAVNRALARWPKRVHELSPRQRIDRVTAVFRYLNRVRRDRQARARDLAIVAEMLRA